MAKDFAGPTELFRFVFDLPGDGNDATTFYVVAPDFASAVGTAKQIIDAIFPGQKLLEVARVAGEIFYSDNVGDMVMVV